MNLEAYLFTINRNNSYKLDPDEIKDVKQEIDLYMINKSYNDLITKKTILRYYQMAVNKKIRSEQLVSEKAYLLNHDSGEHETELKRRDQIGSLNLNDVQKKIVELLVHGFDYKEIRKKFKINDSQLRNHIYRIRAQNCV